MIRNEPIRNEPILIDEQSNEQSVQGDALQSSTRLLDESTALIPSPRKSPRPTEEEQDKEQ
jgi:hypothetical protein